MRSAIGQIDGKYPPARRTSETGSRLRRHGAPAWRVEDMVYVIFRIYGEDRTPPFKQKAVCYSREAVEVEVRNLYQAEIAGQDSDGSNAIDENELFVKWYKNIYPSQGGVICAHAGPYEVRAYP
jgi:hypothetical protein